LHHNIPSLRVFTKRESVSYVGLKTGCETDPKFGIRNSFPAYVPAIPAIHSIAASTGVSLIDDNTPLLNHVELFHDGVHPSAEGAGVIAATVAGVLSKYSDDAIILSATKQ
jgi:sialate O-acetylesterase